MSDPFSNIGLVCPSCSKDRLQPKPEFQNKPLKWFAGRNCKIAFHKEGLTEHMWVSVTGPSVEELCHKELCGRLNNDPVWCTDLKDGDIVHLDRSEIEEVLPI